MSFFKIGDLYKIKDNAMFLVRTTPGIINGVKVTDTANTFFIVLEAEICQDIDGNGKLHEMNKIKVLIENKIGYICFYVISDVHDKPHHYFTRILA